MARPSMIVPKDPFDVGTRAPVVEASKRFMSVAEKLPRLLSLADETVEILFLLEEGNGDESELVARLEEVEIALAQKVDRCAWTVRDLERLADVRKAEADKLRDQAKRLDGAADRLKSLMLVAMQQTGQQRVETPRFTVRIQRNPPKVEVVDEAAVEPRFLRHIPEKWEVNKQAIGANYKATGEIPPGVTVTQSDSLRIA